MATATVKSCLITANDETTVQALIKAELEALAPAATDKFGFAVRDDILYMFKVTTS